MKRNFQRKKIHLIKEKIRRENLIDKKNTSNYRRKKISASDSRTSVNAIGYVGVAFLTSSGLVIVLLDVMSLVKTVQTAMQNIKAMI